MTADQIAVLRSTFDILRARGDAGTIFYARLFQVDPDSRDLFRTDIPEQGRKLMATLASVINGVDEMHLMEPAVRNLGRRHVSYGVTETHYASLGAALLLMLEDCLGTAYTPEVERAWLAAYEELAGIMLRAD